METTSVEVGLTGPAAGFVQDQVTQGGFGSPAAYIISLVDADRVRRSKQQLDALLIEGLESGPPRKHTSTSWAERCREIEENLERPSTSDAR